MNSELFATQAPTKLFFRCVVPAVITSVFGALYSVVDGIFVGIYLGENALVAINLIILSFILAKTLKPNCSKICPPGNCGVSI